MMNTFLVAALLAGPTLSVDSDLDTLFDAQHHEIIQGIRGETCVKLELRRAHFFAPHGELQTLLGTAAARESRLAIR